MLETSPGERKLFCTKRANTVTRYAKVTWELSWWPKVQFTTKKLTITSVHMHAKLTAKGLRAVCTHSLSGIPQKKNIYPETLKRLFKVIWIEKPRVRFDSHLPVKKSWASSGQRFHRHPEYLEIEGTHKDRSIELLALHRTPWITPCGGECYPKISWTLRFVVMITSLGIRFQCPTMLWMNNILSESHRFSPYNGKQHFCSLHMPMVFQANIWQVEIPHEESNWFWGVP